jgi:GT2 family glycosyltransferase
VSSDVLPVSVVVPTLGRERLAFCLASLDACRPRADEVILVVQGADQAVRDLVDSYGGLVTRLLPCAGRGVSRGRNLGIREARNEVIVITDDDCTVATDWIGRAWELVASEPEGIVTGRVLPVGDPLAVPSSKIAAMPYDFTGEVHAGALFPNNMAFHRSAVVAAGGFDEHFGPAEAAEDNEFCYRWLKAGHVLRYEPELVVWHHDWRTPEELERLYVAYARGQGFFYAKHLRRHDPMMLRYIARDLYWALRGLASGIVKRRQRWTDPRRGIPHGLLRGLVDGWRTFGPDALE